MSFYLKDGELLWPTKEGVYDVRSELPVGTYTVGADPVKGFYLKPITDFDIRGKIYGKATGQAERILQTFADRPNATGVLLAGEKGSGKTMLAKRVSQLAAKQGISTLVINTPFNGDAFNTFIQEINEPCLVVFDEFEKVFDNDQQEATLTLLDGVYPTKKLFILTVNDKYRVNAHMQNRPGRIFYMLDFKGLDEEFIEEYCNDNLNNKDYISQVCRLTNLFEAFNFDMLKALVEEMNRYDESPAQAMEMLNAKPTEIGRRLHNVQIYVDGEKLKSGCFWPEILRANPISQERITLGYYRAPDSEEDPTDFEITQDNLKKIDPEKGSFTYVVNEGCPNMIAVVITREPMGKVTAYSWLDAI